LPIGRKGGNAHEMGDQYNIKDLLKIAKKEFGVIAVICKDVDECNSVHGILNDPSIQLLIRDTQVYNKGVVILPVSIARGLEFDYVIIPYPNSYKKNELDARLIYIAMSRAMHKLVIHGSVEHISS
jgi:DNA helicase-2/ATP-dependent DNA helicase PcrA